MLSYCHSGDIKLTLAVSFSGVIGLNGGSGDKSRLSTSYPADYNST